MFDLRTTADLVTSRAESDHYGGSVAAPEVFTDAFFADPHRAYARLRRQGPVHQVTTPNRQQVWLVVGHAEARAALADPRLSKDVRVAEKVYARRTDPAAPSRDFAASLSAHMLNTDPPEHTRLRGLVGRAFTPRTVEALRPRIAEITDALIDDLSARLAGNDTVDLLDALAVPLPTAVICELLGVPEPARDILRDAITDLLSIGDPSVIDRASHTLAGLLAENLAAKRAHPGDDLLTALVAAHDEEDRLTGPELVSMAMLLLVAGHETTVNVIANSALALLQHPDQRERLRAEPDLLPAAVEELLRFDGPTSTVTFRFTTGPVAFGGVEIPAEHPVVISPLAANRDPARFADPDELRLDRDTAGSIAFGHGVHHCLGAALARAEACAVLPALAERLADLRLAVEPGELRRRRSLLVNGLEALPVTRRAASTG
jgi:cytochrome P450